MKHPVYASIVVPSYNAKSTLRDCLRSLKRQVTDFSFEIIVVDSSEDDTADILQTEFPSVHLIKLAKRAYPGAARNAGILSAKGQIMVFADVKMTVQDNWLDLMLSPFDDPRVNAVTGTRVVTNDANLPGLIQYYCEFFDFIGHKKSRWIHTAPAGNSAFRMTANERILFPPELRAAEDTVFCSQWPKGPILLDPKIETTYRPVSTWKQCFYHIKNLGYWSGIARSNYRLRGSFLRIHWITGSILLPYRLGRFALFFIPRLSLENLVNALCLIPIVTTGFAAWTLGFMQGMRDTRQERLAITAS